MSDDTVEVKIVGDASGVASATNQAKTSIDGLAAATKSASNTLATSSSAMRGAMEEVAKSTGNARIAQMEMMHVVRATSESLAMGVDPLRIMTFEMGRVAEAVSLAGGSFGKVGAFLGGPWGMVVIAAATVLTGLISNLGETKSGLDQVKIADDALNSTQNALSGVFDITTGKMAQLNAQKLQLDRQYQAQKTLIEQQAELQRTLIYRNGIKSLSQSWGQSIGQMLTMQTSFVNGIKSLWQGLVGAVGNMVAQMIENWLAKHLAALILGKTAQSTSAVAEVTSYAAVAAAAAWASTAAIPIVGPALAPAAAAAALAGAMAFAPMAAFARGTDFAPGGLALVGEEGPEIVNLPRGSGVMTASQTKDALTNRPANDIHFHVNAMDAKSFKKFAMDHKGPIAEALRKYARDGGR